MTKCEGMQSYRGVLNGGMPYTVPCEEEATVLLAVEQDGYKLKDVTACTSCLRKAEITDAIKILSVKPITTNP